MMKLARYDNDNTLSLMSEEDFAKNEFKSVEELRKDMRENPAEYHGFSWTLVESKPILRIETTSTSKVVEVQ